MIEADFRVAAFLCCRSSTCTETILGPCKRRSFSISSDGNCLRASVDSANIGLQRQFQFFIFCGERLNSASNQVP